MATTNPNLSRIVQETPALDVHSHQGTGGVGPLVYVVK